jgi:C4-dicarboxylate-specific signal transduction histidine kinase
MSLSQIRSDIPTAPLHLQASGGMATPLRYFVPFAAVATAIGATYLLDLAAPESPNLFLFFVAIVISAWFAGAAPGWLSVFLSAIAVDYFFIPPLYVVNFGAKDIAWLVTFVACAIATSALSLQRRRAETLLLQARNELENRVRARTLDLQETNERLVASTAERVRAEGTLRETQNELARAARIMTVGELTASIAHEVNQPLAAVMANGEAALNWLQRSPPALVETRDSVAAIVAAGERAAEIITRIRSLMTRSAPVLTRLDINELLTSVMTLAQTGFKTRDIAMESYFHSDLPLVLGDRVQLQQLVLNLINNAAEAMADVSGRTRTLTVRTERTAGTGIAIIVEDCGRGLADEDSAKLFEPFYSTKQDGTGMGLSICRTIVELHGGQIAAASRPPCGAVFRVELPAGTLP